MTKCDRHIWDTQDNEWCWKCEELTISEHIQKLTNMKVIFLDIDGVLATDKQFMGNRNKFNQKNDWAKELRVPYGFDKGCVKVFNEILEKTEAVIVLSSDWKLHWDLSQLDTIFKENGVIRSPKFVTENLKSSFDLERNRFFEVDKFVKDYNVTEFIAIDDLDLRQGGLKPVDNFFLTKSGEGLKQTGLKDKIIKKLNEDINK